MNSAKRISADSLDLLRKNNATKHTAPIKTRERGPTHLPQALAGCNPARPDGMSRRYGPKQPLGYHATRCFPYEPPLVMPIFRADVGVVRLSSPGIDRS